MNNYIIRNTSINDISEILNLYVSVSSQKAALARKPSEINEIYISNFTKKAIENGLQFVAIDINDNSLVAEIHCYKLEPNVFSHVLSELTIAVHPNHQGKGLGKKLFTHLLNHVKESRKDILRVELIARESNQNAIKMYESIGFVKEGRFEKRIKRDDGLYEADIPMAWMNG